MSVLVSKGKFKSSLMLNSFFSSFLFVLIFAGIYSLLLNAVTAWFEHIQFGYIWGPPIILSLLSTFICQLLVFLPGNKILVPLAFGFLAIYAGLFLVAILTQFDTDSRALAIHLWLLYTMSPVVIGNSISWLLWVVQRQEVVKNHT